jgi:putative photosynthetic complex assembly protein
MTDKPVQPVSRGPFIGVAAIVLLVVAVAVFRQTGGVVSDSRDPDAYILESRELRFEDREDGAVVVLDLQGREVGVLDPGTHGFVRGVMRGMARERRSREVGTEPPYRLAYWSDGRLTLDDPATGRWIELAAFGPDNTGAFARLLASAAAQPDPR